MEKYVLKMSDEEKDQIETFLECLKYAKIDNLKTIQSQTDLNCDHSICSSLLQKLLHLCYTKLPPKDDGAYGIPSSDSCYKHYWNIAKLYCAEDVSMTKAGLRGLDISTLLRMMNSCKLFTFDGSDKLFKIICEDRDELFHSSDNNVSDEKRSIVLEHASNLLSKFCGPRLKVCEEAIGDFQLMETKDWRLEYRYEYKQIARQNLEHRIDAIKLDMSIPGDETLQGLLNSSEALLQMINESISADESEEEQDLQKGKEESKSEESISADESKEEQQLQKGQEEIKSEERISADEYKAKNELQKEIEKIKFERKDVLEENIKLKERVSQFEIVICRLRLHNMVNCILPRPKIYGLPNVTPEHYTSSRIHVTCLGTFQDILIQIDGISILFDPLETKLREYEYFNPSTRKSCSRGRLHDFCLDAVVLSTCLYSFTATTVERIKKNSPNVKWLTTTDKKEWLISLGVIETSIIEFDVWEAKEICFGRTRITFACTKSNINSTPLHGKKCNSCGWVINGSERTFYSSGITNYHEQYFKMVKQKYGPIHLALLPLSPTWNLSCLAKYRVTLSEVINMHVDVGHQQSLGLNLLSSGISFQKKHEQYALEQKMKNLHLDPSTFIHLTTTEAAYESK